MRRRLHSIICVNLIFFMGFIVCTKAPTKPDFLFKGIVQGKVTDFDTQLPINNALVITVPDSIEVSTDSNGNFLLEGLEPNTYTLKAKKEGYKIDSTVVDVLAAFTITANIKIKQLKPVMAVSTSILDFGNSGTELKFSIDNESDYGELSWNIVDNLGFMEVNPTSGVTTNEIDEVTVTIDRSLLSSGNYAGKITLTSNGGNRYIDVIVIQP